MLAYSSASILTPLLRELVGGLAMRISRLTGDELRNRANV